MAITNVGDSQSFSYTGGMQSFTAPQKGVYKLEVWGAAGGYDSTSSSSAAGAHGYGGYSCGYRMMEKGETIYICCGQAGQYNKSGTTYNGGGQGAHIYKYYGGQGGGATHMATMSGTLSAIGSGNSSKVLLVAGGAGGGSTYWNVYGEYGGNGGGSSGGKHPDSGAAAGTQTSGAAFGQGGNGSGTYYDEDLDFYFMSGGGGGGWYGGHGSGAWQHSGSGGSGYVGGVPSFTYSGTTYSPSTTTGSSSANTNGYAKVTFAKKGELPVIFNGTKLQKIIFNGTEITSLIYNGTKLFFERMRGACDRVRPHPEGIKQ